MSLILLKPSRRLVRTPKDNSKQLFKLDYTDEDVLQLQGEPIRKIRDEQGAKLLVGKDRCRVTLCPRIYKCLVILANLHKEFELQYLDLTTYPAFQIRSLGLIGPGDGCLTNCLEYLFGGFSTFRKHAIFHDTFGLYFNRSGNSAGYCYAWPDNIYLPQFLKSSCLFGHITGLLHFILKGFDRRGWLDWSI